MDSDKVNDLIGTIVNGVTQVGVAAGSIYNSFRGSNGSISNIGTTVASSPVVVNTEKESLPKWLFPVGILVSGLVVLISLFKK